MHLSVQSLIVGFHDRCRKTSNADLSEDNENPREQLADTDTHSKSLVVQQNVILSSRLISFFKKA